jgi:DNA polymerase V
MPTIRRDKNIMLVDADAFFVSCEQVFDLKLRNRPVIVLSNNDGIVVARSKEAKKLIPMGAPRFQFDDIIWQHDVAVLSPNYELYGSMSARLMNILSQFSPNNEIYSIDEAFLSFAIKESKPCSVIAHEIRQRVRQWLGLSVTVGIGASKTMAKVAVEYAKKDPQYNGVLDLSRPDSNIDEFLDNLPVEDVWGIGRRYSELLINHNIKTALALRDANDEWVREHMTVMGLRTVHELRGIQCIPIELAPPPKQSIVCSRSFGRYINSITDLKEALATHVTRAAGKLRRQHSIAHSIQVFIQTNQFKTSDPQYSNSITIKLDQPTAYTPELMQAAQAGLERIFQPGYNFKRAGIMLLGLCSEDQMQGGFWGRAYIGRDKKAMEIVDQINARFGKDTIKIAACILTKDKKWQMRSDHCSPRYTTRWDELMIAKAGDITKELSTAVLFWKDRAATCFTLLRYYTPNDRFERALRMASTLEEFSTLQLYGVIANQQVMPWTPSNPAPASGTDMRLRIALYPSEKLNPSAGITNIRISVPGPKREVADIFTAQPAICSHPYWQMLEKEIISWLRLPNGLPVSPASEAARIHYAKFYQIEEELRPQPGKPPVDFAISDAVKKLDEVRSRLVHAERNHLPLEYILARVEKYQQNFIFSKNYIY